MRQKEAIFIFVILVLLMQVIALNSYTENDLTLLIYDDTDEGGTYVRNNVINFYSNFTNTTGIISDGNCTINFQDYNEVYGDWQNMTFDLTKNQFQYNLSFDYKGTFNFEINCTNHSISINVTDSFTISNKAPEIDLDVDNIYINWDGDANLKQSYVCSEDLLCTYNFSANITDEVNDVLTYTNESVNTTLTNFALNQTTGILEINITNSSDTGLKEIRLKVTDDAAANDEGILKVNIQEVNDAPDLSNVENQTFNMSEFFSYFVNITDEENNVPFNLSISFINCSTAEWSSRNNTNCSLFDETEYEFNETTGLLNISFLPLRDDVGDYIINFSVQDTNNLVTPYNASASKIINFSVQNVNTNPYFTYLCDNERNATEDDEFYCYINVTDIDETRNITYTSNYSWFLHNNVSSHNASTDYNSSVMLNFTLSDLQVGNWSINVSVKDNGNPVKGNSSVVWFYVANINDSVSLSFVNNFSAYTGNSYTIRVNASDDDLLIIDKSEYDENLTFYVNVSWVNLTYSSPENSRVDVDLGFTATTELIGEHFVNLSVYDNNNYSFVSQVFLINISGNNVPYWNNLNDTYNLTENALFSLNLSEYVVDLDSDDLTFSSLKLDTFSSFSLTADKIEFTPDDEDVGLHEVWLNVTDSKTPNATLVNFSVQNVNDIPYIEPTLVVVNATSDSDSNVNTSEDNQTEITLWIQDNDFKIPLTQKSYYNESLTLNLTIEGPNSDLFEFERDYDFPLPNKNKTKYVAIFTSNKSDLGFYNVTINVTDLNNASDAFTFVLGVFAINHAPILDFLQNQTSTINRNFYYRINSTDLEEGNSNETGNTNLTFDYSFLYGDSFFNTSVFNATTGEINITFNSSQEGLFHINISVNDSDNYIDSDTFWMHVYGNPVITYPDGISNLSEALTANLTFQANHSLLDNLTFEIYLDGELRYNTSYYGDNTNLTWQYTPNYTEETFNNSRNLNLKVLNPVYNELNTSAAWNISINHTNYPMNFSGYIGDKQSTYNSDITIYLSNHFTDIDNSDVNYNQSVSFSISSNTTPSSISSSVSEWVLTLSASTTTTELLTIVGRDLNDSDDELTNASSNEFEVQFTRPTTVTVPTSGGGGSSRTKPVSLKLILPDPVSAFRKDKVVLPIIVQNNGKTRLKRINLTAFVSKDMKIRNDFKISFDKSYFNALDSGDSENVTMTLDIDTDELGQFEITINGTVEDPEYTDWGKLYLTVKETNLTEVLEKIIFTEELIAENPECIEIQEIANEARELYNKGDSFGALEKTREAIESCKYAISQQALPSPRIKYTDEIYKYVTIATIAGFLLGIFYYLYKRNKLKKVK